MKLGVYVGRFSPLHLGHEEVIHQMLSDYDYDHCLLLIGSANTDQSMRHLFTYADRKEFIKKQFPLLRVAPLPDFKSNDEWYTALDDLIRLTGGHAPDSTFYTGCLEDVGILHNYLPIDNFKFCNRFDGTTPIISASQVRDILLNDNSLKNIVHENLQQKIKLLWTKRWQEFKLK